ncbi:3718_t:CDS:2 [Ambispora gerdemannii]|uniref:3718_t:CDS:1 n=1 Tax=Ambispora gerdemannii TaxID=144530 RepID=A0A9N9E8I1_9GLOM|nr:3718_t:CDS:2 [Ambispora gerdemannii]
MNAELCEQDMKSTSNVKSIFHVELTNQVLQSDANEEIAESSSQLQDSANEDINISNEIVNLCVGYVFELWEEIDKIIKTYGKREGFGVVRKRLELHPKGHIKHRSYRYEFSDRSQPKKKVDIHNHHDRKLK